MNPVVRERFKSYERALKLQAREYERRLEALNHEADRIKASQDKSISVERFDGFVHQFNSKFDQTVTELRKDIKLLSDESRKDEGKSEWKQYIPWGIATALAALSLYLTYR